MLRSAASPSVRDLRPPQRKPSHPHRPSEPHRAETPGPSPSQSIFQSIDPRYTHSGLSARARSHSADWDPSPRPSDTDFPTISHHDGEVLEPCWTTQSLRLTARFLEFTLRDEPQQVALRLVESCQVPHYSEHQRHCVQLRLTEPCITGRLVTFSLGSERECKRLASEINNAAAGAGAIEEICRAADTLEDFALRLSSTEAASSMALRPECGSFFFGACRRRTPRATVDPRVASERSRRDAHLSAFVVGTLRGTEKRAR